MKRHFRYLFCIGASVADINPRPDGGGSKGPPCGFSILICYILHCLGSLLAEFGLAAVISPVSVADKAKSDDFDL